MDNRTTNMVLVGIAVLALLMLMGGMWLVFQGMNTSAEPAAPPPSATAVAALPTETTPAEALPPTETLPPTAVVLLPSATPPPTVTPTDTPVATDTPIPTDTATPAPPTNTPVPIPPTNTPVPPPPTNTPGPPPGPQPVSINGLSGTHFAVQSRAQIQVNGKIWFEFEVSNSTGGNVSFSQLGVMPRKDGNDRLNWYQNSWGGNDDKIPSNGLRWEDNIKLPESGSYTLRLVICFDGKDACRSGSGTWHTLSQEIPVTLP